MMMMALIEQATDVVGEYVFKKIDIFVRQMVKLWDMQKNRLKTKQKL